MIDPTEDSALHEAPATTAIFNGVQLSTRILPATDEDRSADWCEVFAVGEDVVALSIGDICGHGMEKFAAMVVLRQAIRDAARNGSDPAQILAHANAALRYYDPTETATALFALLNTRERLITFANAGHPPPLMVGPLGSVFIEYPESDVPIGVARTLVPELRTLNAPPATLFVFYTDGVTDRERSTLRGMAQLREAAQTAHLFPDAPAAMLIEELMFLTQPNADDAAILTARTPWTPLERKPSARRDRGDRISRIALNSIYTTMRAPRQ